MPRARARRGSLREGKWISPYRFRNSTGTPHSLGCDINISRESLGVGSTERPREWAHYKRLRRLVYLRLFTVDAEIIVSHRYGAVSIDGDVRSFMHQEVISGTLANYPEVVYEG